jgi:hypothetical protein
LSELGCTLGIGSVGIGKGTEGREVLPKTIAEGLGASGIGEGIGGFDEFE